MSRSIAGKPIVRKLFSSSQVGVVVSAGLMDKAVKVRIAGQEWNKKFRKVCTAPPPTSSSLRFPFPPTNEIHVCHTNSTQHFPSQTTHLVSDPTSSLVTGDVVRISSGWRTSKHIRHVVTSIVAPFGSPVEDRPPILTEEQRMELRVKQRLMKDVRAAQAGRQVSLQRLAEARRQKVEVPSLEEAMRNVRIGGEEGKARKEKHAGETGQAETKRERRVIPGRGCL